MIEKQTGDKKRNWYAVHTYSGYENVVIKNIKQRVESLGMEKFIFDAILPKEKVIKVKNKKRVEEEVVIYPGYVLVDMVVTDKSWHLIRNTPRVTGFVGTGIHPVPVSETEMAFMLDRLKGADNADHAVDFIEGELIKIIDGPFKGTEGKVLEFNGATSSVKVSVSMFSRDTELELDYLQIKKI